ncbi:Hypothetical predicted protein [Olea europaea subsp. europaea]|uniref:Uncharacterized protein n=1 Tax=Olea europaea subsp. europaea TaxID=158383 RepID=A0A8S0VD01_OLEEU|nr:Hypothetical predicted protein [Olea europaea subsp. europaea]
MHSPITLVEGYLRLELKDSNFLRLERQLTKRVFGYACHIAFASPVSSSSCCDVASASNENYRMEKRGKGFAPPLRFSFRESKTKWIEFEWNRFGHFIRSFRPFVVDLAIWGKLGLTFLNKKEAQCVSCYPPKPKQKEKKRKEKKIGSSLPFHLPWLCNYHRPFVECYPAVLNILAEPARTAAPPRQVLAPPLLIIPTH